MLKHLHIEGFQCHVDRLIEFDPKVTVLVGDNDAGKSAAIRALKWVALNEWDGKADAFIHWDKADARVTLKLGKVTICRSKGKSGNTYTINQAQPLEAVGGNVPDEVQQIIQLGRDNFHDQNDPAFWFELTAGQVAKSLNRIVNLCSIDDSLQYAKTQVLHAKDREKSATAALETATQERNSLDWVPEVDNILIELEESDRKVTELKRGCLALARRLEEVSRASSKAKDARQKAQALEKACGELEKLANLGTQVASLRSSVQTITAKAKELKCLRSELDEKEERLNRARKTKCPLCLK